jgi:hypothetical protein
LSVVSDGVGVRSGLHGLRRIGLVLDHMTDSHTSLIADRVVRVVT